LIQQTEIEFWGVLFKRYKEWKDKVVNTAKNTGIVDSSSGFRVGGILDKKSVTNMLGQSSGAHCLLLSMCGIYNDLERLTKPDGTKLFRRTLLIGEIHDSILAAVSSDELDLYLQLCHYWMTKRVPEIYTWLTVPLEIEADVAPADMSWAEKKGYKINTDYDERILGLR
jgi:hypothetical protein